MKIVHLGFTIMQCEFIYIYLRTYPAYFIYLFIFNLKKLSFMHIYIHNLYSFIAIAISIFTISKYYFIVLIF